MIESSSPAQIYISGSQGPVATCARRAVSGQSANMCVQVVFLFQCGHRGFDKVDRCSELGRSCFGPGSKSRDNPGE